jgi:3-methyladenine DNA glycosylase AlkD
MQLKEIRKTIRGYQNKKKAKILQSFFKIGPGDYAEGDKFLGIQVPVLRRLAVEFQNSSLKTTVRLLKSFIHEERLLALLILILKYRKADLPDKKKIYDLYLKNTKYINNWDLVDVTAKHVVGAFLMDRDKAPLYKLAKSDCLWERRIAILSTFHFIEHNSYDDTLKIAEVLLLDSHDLIHKAVGWMLREIGKRDFHAENNFLKKFHKKMPRTMLRYAIERFSENKRKAYLNCPK